MHLLHNQLQINVAQFKYNVLMMKLSQLQQTQKDGIINFFIIKYLKKYIDKNNIIIFKIFINKIRFE